MKIAIIGAGAIGGLVAAYLKSAGEDVSVVGRPEAVKVIQANGLSVSGVRGDFKVNIDASERLIFSPQLAILSTKTQDIEDALKDNLEFLQYSLVLTIQNGVRADIIASDYISRERIISSIVMFGATNIEPGRVVHNFEGDWVIGKASVPNDNETEEVKAMLGKAFSVDIRDDIKGMKYLKLFVNANNCIPAILGVSMQEAFADTGISLISIAIWKEGLRIIRDAGIKLVSLPDFPLERLIKLTSIPAQEAAKIFSGVMTTLSKEPLYGSILQSIKRGKPSEIDYINGEFVSLAEANKIEAPLNKRLLQMVHTVEKTKLFFSREELIRNTAGLI